MNQTGIKINQLKQEQLDIPRLQQRNQFMDIKVGQNVNNPNVLTSNPGSTDNETLTSNQMKKKKNEHQKVLEDHERQQIVQEMANSKLGEMCPVCYKIFRNKDALEFHIMNTKMMGHESLVQERVKSNASVTMGSSTIPPNIELAIPSLDEPTIDVIEGIFDSSETNPPVDGTSSEMEDSSSVMIKRPVKQEPISDNETLFSPSIIENNSKSKHPEVDDKTNQCSKIEQKQLFLNSNEARKDQGLNDQVSLKKLSTSQENVDPQKRANIECNESKLMPPPSTIKMAKKKPSSNKIFKCFECNRAFKKDWKLIKHVTRKHSSNKKQSNIQSDKMEVDLKNSDLTQQDKSEKNSSQTYSQSASKTETPSQNGNTSGKEDNSASLKYSPMGCPDCVVLFPTQDLMMQHFSRSPHRLMCNLNVNKCPVLTCDVSFATKSKLLEHLVAGKHGQPCPQCGKDFPKVSTLLKVILGYLILL